MQKNKSKKFKILISHLTKLRDLLKSLLPGKKTQIFVLINNPAQSPKQTKQNIEILPVRAAFEIMPKQKPALLSIPASPDTKYPKPTSLKLNLAKQHIQISRR